MGKREKGLAFVFLFMVLVAGTSPARAGTEGETGTARDAAADAIWSSEASPRPAEVSDPLEPWNRLMFSFNDKLSAWILEPLATGYKALVPEGGRIAVRNVFHNLETPVHVTNALLQGKGKAAGEELGRFLINSTVGIGGLFDIAALHFNLHSGDEDLGQTLGHYGVGDGIYMVWPVLGPANVRDTVGAAGDWFLDPLNYKPEGFWDQTGIKFYARINEVSLRLEEFQSLRKDTLDPYVALRNGYTQRRREKVAN